MSPCGSENRPVDGRVEGRSFRDSARASWASSWPRRPRGAGIGRRRSGETCAPR
jgi:hypothetical protein